MKSLLDDGEMGEGQHSYKTYGDIVRETLSQYTKLEWLRNQFEADDLVDIALAIAMDVFPKGRWTIVGNNDHSIVVNHKLSIVLDLKYFDRISALESLFFAGDSET